MTIIEDDKQIMIIGSPGLYRTPVLYAPIDGRKWRAVLKDNTFIWPKGRQIKKHQLNNYLKNDLKNYLWHIQIKSDK